jgi:hypothetical protein
LDLKKIFKTRELAMDEKIARLRAHQRNIDRYQRLLKTKLSDLESEYLERRLSEERFWIAMLGGPSSAPSSGRNLRGTLE